MLAAFAIGSILTAQVEIAEVRGRVFDPSRAAVPGAQVVLFETTSGFERVTITDARGAFRFLEVPHGLYAVHVGGDEFRTYRTELVVRSNLALDLDVTLELAGPDEKVTVRAGSPLVDDRSPGATTRLDESFVARFPGLRPGAEVQQLVATAPGWSSEDNGLLHAKGVDDGFLFVLDGMPQVDRADTFFSSAVDVEALESVEILDGHLPVEYGFASGGVIRIVPRSGLEGSWNGTLSLRGGSEATGSVAATVGGRLRRSLGLFTAGSLGGSGERYLDPVDPDNFNNQGSNFRWTGRLDWRLSSRDLVVANLAVNGSEFRVTNTLEQEEAGQRQRQELNDDHESLLWQRSWSSETVTDAAWYRHAFSADLLPSDADTPLSAAQDREHVRQGALVNVTHLLVGHTFKVGIDLQHVRALERFSFFVTDPELAEESDLSEEALEYTERSPFVFADEVSRSQFGFFVQDTFTLLDSLTINAGLRFDRTSILVEDSQLSPRIGAVYALTASTAVRGFYNRLFKPPQVENLLLSSSEEARALSPFADEGGGGSQVSPESQHAFEVGASQSIAGRAAVDVSYWRRSVRNYADPNVFFGTTIIFPNSVAEGTASGVSLRLDFPRWNGFSGFASYSNSLVYQVGPVNGGLFLEDDIIEIGPGMRFSPDHDQRNVGAWGLTYQHERSGFWSSLYGRYESGTPLEIDEDDLDGAMERRGAGLVDFDRGRVKPRTLLDIALGIELFRNRRVAMDLGLDLRNVTNDGFAYNFSNPFSGTHFGHPRLVSARVKLVFD
jgi:outer membrane receptor protein involved in Fe transport